MKREEQKKFDEIYRKHLRRPIPEHMSPEFKEFIREEKRKPTWYEKLCNTCGRILRIEISEDNTRRLRQKLDFC